MADPHRNEIPWHLVEHYHIHKHDLHNHRHHKSSYQSLIKVPTSTASSNNDSKGSSTARDRERKRKSKFKPKSFHHLSLVTRFQLGLRMSRLRSKQRPSCPDLGLCRNQELQDNTKLVVDEIGKRTNTAIACKTQNDENAEMGKDPTSILLQHSIIRAEFPCNQYSGNDFIARLPLETRITNSSCDGNLLQRFQDKTMENVSDCKTDISPEENSITNKKCHSNEHYIPTTKSCSSRIKEYFSPDPWSESIYETEFEMKRRDFQDQHLPKDDNSETPNISVGASLSSQTQSNPIIKASRPKVVITLPGTKPFDKEENHVQPSVRIYKTKSTSSLTINDQRTSTPEEICNNGITRYTQTKVTNSTYQKSQHNPYQGINTSMKESHLNSIGKADNNGTSKLDSNNSRQESELFGDASFTNDSNAKNVTNYIHNEESSNGCASKLPKGKVVFIVKPKLYDEIERERLYQTSNLDETTEKPNVLRGNTEQFQTTEEKSDTEDTNQRKIKVADNKLLCKPNFVNKQNEECLLSQYRMNLRKDNNSENSNPNPFQIKENNISDVYQRNKAMLCSLNDNNRAIKPEAVQIQNVAAKTSHENEMAFQDSNNEEFQNIMLLYYSAEQYSTLDLSETGYSIDSTSSLGLRNKNSTLNTTIHHCGNIPTKTMQSNMTAKPIFTNPNDLNINHASPVVLVPSSSVFSVTPPTLSHEFNKNHFAWTTPKDNSTVTWSNSSYRLDNEILPHDDTKVPSYSNRIKLGGGLDVFSSKMIPLKDYIPNIDFSCDYEIPVRKDCSADEMIQYTLSASKTMHYLNDFSKSQQFQPMHYSERKTPSQNIVNERVQNITNASTVSNENNNELKISAIENFIGWVPIGLADFGEKGKKPSVYIPINDTTSKQHDVVRVDLDAAMKTRKMVSPLHNFVISPTALARLGNKSENRQLSSSSTHSKLITSSTSTTDKRLNLTNDKVLLPCGPTDISWLQMATQSQDIADNYSKGSSEIWTNQNQGSNIFTTQKSESFADATPQLKISNLPTKNYETINFSKRTQKPFSGCSQTSKTTPNIIPQDNTFKFVCSTQEPIAVNKLEKDQFEVEISGSVPFATHKPDTVTFATPASDLLSSVAKVPDRKKSMCRNLFHNIYNKGMTSFKLMESVGSSTLFKTRDLDGVGSEDVPGKPHFSSTNMDDASRHVVIGQPSLYDKVDENSEIWNEKSEQKVHCFEHGIKGNTEKDYKFLVSRQQSLTDSNIQSEKGVESMANLTNVSSINNPGLIFLRDDNHSVKSAKTSLGTVHPFSTSTSQMFTYELKKDTMPITLSSNIYNSSALAQSFDPCSSSGALPSSISTDRKAVNFSKSHNSKSVDGIGYRPPHLFTARQFIGEKHGEQIEGGTGKEKEGQNYVENHYTPPIYRITSNPTNNEKLVNAEMRDNDGISCLGSEKGNNASNKERKWKNTSIGQPYHNDNDETVQQLSTILKNNEKESLKRKNNLVGPTDVTIGPGKYQYSTRDVPDRNTTTGGLPSRSEFRYNNGVRNHFVPEIPTFLVCSASSFMPKSYKEIDGNSINKNNNISQFFNNSNSNVCPICLRRFTRPWLLKGHMRTHTGERPFQCSFPSCEKAFADKSNLRSHMQTHTAITKNFECTRCGRAFSQKRYLHKHNMEVCKFASK